MLKGDFENEEGILSVDVSIACKLTTCVYTKSLIEYTTTIGPHVRKIEIHRTCTMISSNILFAIVNVLCKVQWP